ncbi:MAG: hypothetical protein R3220_08105 [Balneolaceae bacterium]|nr:hypothetical protein [Balneolaceae bacterium]
MSGKDLENTIKKTLKGSQNIAPGLRGWRNPAFRYIPPSKAPLMDETTAGYQNGAYTICPEKAPCPTLR